jgi:flagellar protein FliS
MQSTELSYRKTAAEGASGFGLLIALYDTLAGNLRRAADAERNNNLEKRCSEVNHALLVIGYLEDCIDRASGGELSQKLVRLYASLRRILIEAQVKRSPEILEQQMEQMLDIRETWQTMEFAGLDAQCTFHGAPVQADHNALASNPSHTLSWSA